MHCGLYSKLVNHPELKFSQITGRCITGPYPNVGHVYDQHARGNLVLNDQMLMFHQRYDGGGLVYNTDQ